MIGVHVFADRILSNLSEGGPGREIKSEASMVHQVTEAEGLRRILADPLFVP